MLRCDNARYFLSQVISYINSVLETRRVTGATYHPQSQGSVERMHRSINNLMKGIFEKVTTMSGNRRWVEYLPLIVGHLRAMNMAVLGGRSPMEVVMGVKPRLPQTITSQLPVRAVGIDQYVKDLVQALGDTWRCVRDVGREIAQAREGTASGSGGELLERGDLALRIATGTERPRGSERFQDRYDGAIYRVRRVVGAKTYILETLNGDALCDDLGNEKRISGEELVKCALPELELGLDEQQPRRLEVQSKQDHNLWEKATVDGLSPDGRVFLRYDKAPRNRVLTDLTELAYRWLHGDVDAVAPAEVERRSYSPLDPPGPQVSA